MGKTWREPIHKSNDPFALGTPSNGWTIVALAAQKSHRKIAVTTVAADRLATISLQKSQGFPPRRPQKKSLAASDFGMQLQLAFKKRRKIASFEGS